jgi:hypothetical protein
MQAGTTPKKRTSLNGRAALKLMRLDGARRADQAASNARVTKASSSVAAPTAGPLGWGSSRIQTEPCLRAPPQPGGVTEMLAAFFACDA